MEKIICSAIWLKDVATPVHRPTNISTGVVLCGHRHPHIIGQINILLGKTMAFVGEYEQGFLTDKNRFVDRKEAMIIARNAKQYIRSSINTALAKELYSEDIY